MNRIQLAIEHPLWVALGATMLHFLWAGAVVGLLAWATRRWIPSTRPNLRYGVLLFYLILLTALPFLILERFGVTQGGGKAPLNDIGFVEDFASPDLKSVIVFEGVVPVVSSGKSGAFVGLKAGLSWLWCLGSTAFLVVFVFRGLRVLRLRHTASPVLDDIWASRLGALAKRLGVRRDVQLRQHPRPLSPLVLGWIKPVILLPAAAVSGLSSAQIEMVLLHELAHVRRHDFLVNLLQRLIECLLFYHPAVWLLSRWISEERECCCDELVVSETGSVVDYAELLARYVTDESFAGTNAMGSHPVVNRLRRILGQQREPQWSTPVSAGVVSGSLALALLWANLIPLGFPGRIEAEGEVGGDAWIEGQVLEAATGRPVEGASISIVAETNDPDDELDWAIRARGTSGDDGLFRVRAPIDRVEYSLFIRHPALYLPGSRRIHPGEKPLPVFELRRFRTIPLSGRVRDLDSGTGVAGVEIILLHEHRFLDRVTTGRDGFFEHPVIPGGDYLVGGMSADGGHIRWTALEVPRDKSSVELDLQLEEPASLTFDLGVGLGADDQVGEDSFLILYPWPFDYGHSREAEIEKMSTVLHRVPLSSAAALRIDDIAPGEYSAILELPRAREASSGSHYHRISKIFLESGNHKTITTPIDRGIDLPVVEARAIQPDGEPWANLRLWIDQAGWPWSNAKIEALTDGDGRFTFPLNRDRLLERSGRINIQGANGASGGVTYVGQVGLQDILLVPSIRISGQVRDAAGEPVVGAKVQAMDRQARSGQEGRFEIFAVVRSDADQEADELFLDVDPIGRDGLDGQGALMHVRRERLPFVARDDLSFDIKLADAAVVEAEGRIVDGLDRPVPGAKVWIYAGTPSEAQWNPIHWEDGPWYGSSNNKAPLIATSTSDAGGHWESRFGKWNESDYRVHWGVVPPYPMDEYFVVAMGSSGAVAYAEGIESVPSLEVGDLVLSQPPSAQHVTGQLLDTEGRPLAGARIEAPSYSRAPIWTETDEDGKFALYSRSRELRVVMGKEMTFPMIEESNGEWIAESISDNQVHIEWSNGGPVKAIRWFKEPISGTPYDVLYFRRAVERAGTETLISKDGVFQFPKTLPAEPIIIYSLEGVYTTVDATALSRPESQLVFEYPAEELSCRVIGLNGDPLAGLSVAAMSDVGNFFRVLTTDEGGKCQWRVPPGRYRVSILGEGTGRYDETDSHEVILNVIPGEANEVLFEPALPPRGTLDLIFSRPDGSPITGQISLSEHQMEVPFVPERKVALDQRGSVRLEVPAGRQYVQMEGLPGLGENEVRRVRLEIGPGKAKQERIVIGTSPPINGRIVRNGEAVNGATVYFTSSTDASGYRYSQCITDASGRFSFTDIPEEELPGDGRFAARLKMDFKPYGIDEMIELTANPDQEVELSYCDVKGNVLLEGGRPADGFSIAWSRQDEDSGFSDESKTNHSGDVFDVKLPPGTYELEFNHRVGLSYETFARKTLEIGAGESERELTIRQGEGF